MDTLADWIREYLDDDEIALDPSSREAEVRQNTWTFDVAGSSPEDASEVIAALRDVADGLRRRLQNSAARGKFYAWYDEQAGQLRCSLTSLQALPFGAPLRELPDPSEVVHTALNDPSPGTVDLSEAVDVPVDYAPGSVAPLAVWVAPV